MKPPLNPFTNQPTRECILCYGPPNVGKSTNWKSIIQAYEATDTPGTFYVVDTDGYAAQKLLSSTPELAHRVVLYKTKDWETFRQASREIMKSSQIGDWVIVDFADRPWNFVQNYFSRTVFGGSDEDEFDEAEYLLKLRAEWQEKEAHKPKKDRMEKQAKSNMAEGWDWGYINDLYDKRMLPLILETPAHVYLTSKAGDLNKELEQDVMKKLMFGEVGLKPAGQKSLPYQVDTVVLQKFVAGQRTITTTAKDRERTTVTDAVMNDFATQYLVSNAGWSLTEK